MSAIIMDGKRVAREIEEILAMANEGVSYKPKLLIVTDNSDPASQVYIRNKVKSAERCGIETEILDVSKESHKVSMGKIFHSKHDGIIVQLPMKEEHADDFIRSVPFDKDVDALGVWNIGLLHGPSSNRMTPCTPKGIMKLLDAYGINPSGKHAVVIGRSHLVGRPVAELLLQKDATVTICHSRTKNLPDITKQADILISAVGKEKLVTADMVKPGAVVIDVGINRNADGKLCGDVDFESVKEIAGYITPVPGGVGPMTVACLMENVMEALPF